MLKSEKTLNAVFKCLSDPGRRAMLEQLTRGEATLGQLAAPLDMSLPAVHQHLGALERARLVVCEKRGRERWCRLDSAALRSAEQWIADRRSLWERRLGALDSYLSNPKGGRNRP